MELVYSFTDIHNKICTEKNNYFTFSETVSIITLIHNCYIYFCTINIKIKIMKRTVIKIDEELCNGCGNCVSGCHEGALQLINGKAVMVSELYCDGLGACIGECPVGAIELIDKETEPYNEAAVMERIAPKGEKTILAHLMACGCPSSMERDFRSAVPSVAPVSGGNISVQPSQLRQWPVQLHLLNPMAAFFKGADVLLASDCSAFTYGGFHGTFLKNKTLAIACPKLDSNTQSYVDKLVMMMDEAKINTLTVLIMEVPCCGGLIQIAKSAREKAKRNVPIKAIVLTVQGEIKSEDWVGK